MKLEEVCYVLAKRYNYDYDNIIQELGGMDGIGEMDRYLRMPSPIVQDQFIAFFEERYPMSLHALRKPPIHLCYHGDISLLQRPMVAVIGSRLHSEYGSWITKELVARLDSRIVIVSGLAMGIDGIAHEAAMASGKKTIGIIGSGLDHCYPLQNKPLYEAMGKDHLILSEYQHDTPIRKHHFPARNRIIAGLADVLVVIESKIRSGSSTTVREALELGKDIYCVPHRLNDPLGAGNHLMIQEGANIIYDIDEFCRSVYQQFCLTNS